MTPKLYLNHITGLDWLIALEFGRVDDGQPPENWAGVTDAFGWYRDGADGPVMGFKIVDFSEFDPEAPDVESIWDDQQFDVPLLGLSQASAGEIVVASRPLLNGMPTLNRVYFSAAIEAGDDQETALAMWLACLQAGDCMAHFGLGYTLYELDRHHEAYRHLRHYTEIAPFHPWNWCWLGKAAEAIGETAEARAAYDRALELESDTERHDPTDAAELLDALDALDARSA